MDSFYRCCLLAYPPPLPAYLNDMIHRVETGLIVMMLLHMRTNEMRSKIDRILPKIYHLFFFAYKVLL